MNLIKKKNYWHMGSPFYMPLFWTKLLFSKIALDITTPLNLRFRFLLAFLFLSLLVAFRIIKINYRGKSLKNLFILSLAQPVIYFIFETYGIKFSSTSHAGLMTAPNSNNCIYLRHNFLKESLARLSGFYIIICIWSNFYYTYG